jgi:hypothetical protein
MKGIPADLISQARDTPIEHVAEMHGLKLKRQGSERVGPCPVCGGDDRFAINVRKQVFNCRGCGGKGIGAIDLEIFLSGCDFRRAIAALTGHSGLAAEPRQYPNTPDCQDARPRPSLADDEAGRTAAAIALWNAAVDLRGTPAQAYLEGRGLVLDLDDVARFVLRWHAGISAMLALFKDIVTDEPRAISRTYLDQDARKIERRFLGPTRNAAIKPDAPYASLEETLHIGEGVETCLAARRLGFRPCWALGSKGAIANFPTLETETLIILAEPDAERETQQCAARWLEAGHEVRIARTIGVKDANDLIMWERDHG